MKNAIFFIFIITTNSLDNKNYCIKPKEKCVKTSFGFECTKQDDEKKCEGNFGVKCDNEYCAVDQKSCTEMSNLQYELKFLQNLSFRLALKKSLQKIKHIIFELKLVVQICPFSTIKFKTSDICLNSENICR